MCERKLNHGANERKDKRTNLLEFRSLIKQHHSFQTVRFNRLSCTELTEVNEID